VLVVSALSIFTHALQEKAVLGIVNPSSIYDPDSFFFLKESVPSVNSNAGPNLPAS